MIGFHVLCAGCAPSGVEVAATGILEGRCTACGELGKSPELGAYRAEALAAAWIHQVASCPVAQLDKGQPTGKRVRLVALRVGAVVTERQEWSKTARHSVKLYQLPVGVDDRLSWPLQSAVPGSKELTLSILGDLPSELEPGSVLRLLSVATRDELNDQDRSYLEQTEAAE